MKTIGIRACRSFSAACKASPLHVRHADVEHETPGPRRVEDIEKRLRRGKGFGAEPDRGHELPDRVAHGLVVIDDEHGGFAHLSFS
jgi:hypothetical protein